TLRPHAAGACELRFSNQTMSLNLRHQVVSNLFVADGGSRLLAYKVSQYNQAEDQYCAFKGRGPMMERVEALPCLFRLFFPIRKTGGVCISSHLGAQFLHFWNHIELRDDGQQ